MGAAGPTDANDIPFQDFDWDTFVMDLTMDAGPGFDRNAFMDECERTMASENVDLIAAQIHAAEHTTPVGVLARHTDAVRVGRASQDQPRDQQNEIEPVLNRRSSPPTVNGAPMAEPRTLSSQPRIPVPSQRIKGSPVDKNVVADTQNTTSTQNAATASTVSRNFTVSDLAFGSTDEAERAQCPRAGSLRWDPLRVADASYPHSMLEEKTYVCQILDAMHDFSETVDNAKVIEDYRNKIETVPKEIETSAWILLRGVRAYHDRGGPLYDTNTKQPIFRGDFAGHVTSLCDNLYSVSKTSCKRLLGKPDVVAYAVDDPVACAGRAGGNRKANAKKAAILQRARQARAQGKNVRSTDQGQESTESQAVLTVTPNNTSTKEPGRKSKKRVLSADDDDEESSSLIGPKRQKPASRPQDSVAKQNGPAYNEHMQPQSNGQGNNTRHQTSFDSNMVQGLADAAKREYDA